MMNIILDYRTYFLEGLLKIIFDAVRVLVH